MGGRTYVPVCSFVFTLIIPSSLPRKVNSTCDPRFLFPHLTYSYLPPLILHASEEVLRGSAGIEFELCLGGDREGRQAGRQGGQLEAHWEKCTCGWGPVISSICILAASLKRVLHLALDILPPCRNIPLRSALAYSQ
ncbi:hypothetical protein FA13DRAFT_342371 [Coprinellus micaceus]|uniref:Uncharacterized protein n=1 Tax=Coprinellus micaceus TaxID=71717 RepID=A0A4Y7SD45_COPMI|nr:hypothetical protein FA13DRAFT_342371 [Coprinellus micaceus]